MSVNRHEDQLSDFIVILDWDKELLRTNLWSMVYDTLKRLPTLTTTPNAIVNLVHPTAGTLSIGIAGSGDKDNHDFVEPVACINYAPKSNDPPYLSVVGNENMAKEYKLVVFRYEQGEWTEVPLRNCVALVRMYEIVKHFIFHATLPTWIGWEEL